MQPTAANPLMQMAPIIAIFAIFYFLLIRPQQKQQKEHEAMLKNLKSGDKVLTTGGLYGTITGFKGDDLEVQFSQTVKLTVARSAVTRRVDAQAAVAVAA
ncbi:MAG: preprotein translocase subunit YajC [Elusimicrobia bacterium RBG_16_66_12]|nr:MAG: preprotein translocase subunit YajC [Elusimicrobia bacterium RBG_16_66_12]